MSQPVTTPASCARRRTVAVLGAGIAGLTAAQELAERGFDVTVYEPREDERNAMGGNPAGTYPTVKLGGLAASQYATVKANTSGAHVLRPFPRRRGQPQLPNRAVAGEHGFRFFPAYYLHIWDQLQRIPVYEPQEQADWRPTSRTVMDNVRRVVTQGTTVNGKPSLVFPREMPRTLAELVTAMSQTADLGFSAPDVQTFASRLLRYLVTSPLRRSEELRNLSAYDFFVGRSTPESAARYTYSPQFDALLSEMPRVLAAYDSRWGDARTTLSTYLQLQQQMGRLDNKADGVLVGPTTEAWFDHWYRHLCRLGVRFVCTAVDVLDMPAEEPHQPPHLRSRVQVKLSDGTRVAPDYTVVAVDAPTAERVTMALRDAGTGGTVAELDGFATSIPPPDGPLQPKSSRPQSRRDPYAIAEMGRLPWDRFQTLSGIQYYFDTEFQLLRGHMYYSGTEWALSSINQHGMWEQRPTLARDGHVAVLSVDIGDFNMPSRKLLNENGRGKSARDCTPDEIAAEVWRQIADALTSDLSTDPEEMLPCPAWYTLDQSLITEESGYRPGSGRICRNETPYLVPIVGDWANRPGPEPWNPHGTSESSRQKSAKWLEDLQDRHVWQARHGGYQIHHNSVVFAGTWTRTFTRMTSMEAACESARHAVNAILDHYIWFESDGADPRDKTTLNWRLPADFLDQGTSSPIRMPTPAGDYCFVFDIENREPADALPLRLLDAQRCRDSLPHALDGAPTHARTVPTLPVPPFPGDQRMHHQLSTAYYQDQLLAYLQTWRQFLEQVTTSVAPGLILPASQWPVPSALAVPPAFAPTVSPPATAPPGVPADYTQHLLDQLQAWRKNLEEATGATPPAPATTLQPTGEARSVSPKAPIPIDVEPRGTPTDHNRIVDERPPQTMSGAGKQSKPASAQRHSRELSHGSAFATKTAAPESNTAVEMAPKSLFAESNRREAESRRRSLRSD